MARFNVSVDHNLARNDAIDRLKSFWLKVRQQSKIEISELIETWDEQGNLDFSFRTMGFKFSGNVMTDETTVVVAGHMPFAALAFRGVIESEIAEKVREAIA
jgi:hypothetical protein